MTVHAGNVVVLSTRRNGAVPTTSDARGRAALWLRRRFPRDASKTLQSLFNLEQRTAERVLAGDGSWPVIVRIGEAFGPDFTLYVMHGAEPHAAGRCFWATESGAHAAPDGLGAYVRDRLGPALTSSDADLVHHALVNLGWVSIEQAGDSVSLKHGEAVEESALRHARDWLGAHSPACVSINGTERHDYLAAMMRLEELVGPREAMLLANWRVERRSFDAIKAQPLKRFLKLCHDNRDDASALPKILTAGGFMANAALMNVHGDSIVSLWAGPNLGVNPAQVMGRDLRDRPGDPRYPEMVRAHVLQACREPEGTYHELRGVEIDGVKQDYNRAAWAAPVDSIGRRFVATVVERQAA